MRYAQWFSCMTFLLTLVVCENGYAQVFKCKDPVTGQTTFTDTACGTSGRRDYVPLQEANGMKPPGRSPYANPPRQQKKSSQQRVFASSSGYDPARDAYERRRTALTMEGTIDAMEKLKVLESQYRTSQKLSGSDKQQYDRISTSLRQQLDSRRSSDEQWKARHEIGELNKKHGGKDPYTKPAGSKANAMPITPSPPSVITHCDPGAGGVCHDNLGGVYIKAGPNTLVPTAGGQTCTRSGGVVICP